MWREKVRKKAPETLVTLERILNKGAVESIVCQNLGILCFVSPPAVIEGKRVGE